MNILVIGANGGVGSLLLQQLAKENALRKAKADKIFWHKVMIEAGKVVLVLLFAGAMIGFVYWAATAPKIR